MTIATIEIPDKKTTLVKQLLKELGVTVKIEKEEKSPYDPKFVAKIKKADKDIVKGRTKKIPIADLWK
ncbi:DUF2683 family protein [Pedobacter fastidiosus]|uniref:Uncharacterized protein n=1 Tax=Pedobacter fastidiosus TaxID=2765361 RepID=A0ABR7KMY9_9SPHI|nr:DUF2683 family protein [Pedobacter fastidiosus]MBC6109444.1 hypothetical protein [Pedobacter fastidiosus]